MADARNCGVRAGVRQALAQRRRRVRDGRVRHRRVRRGSPTATATRADGCEWALRGRDDGRSGPDKSDDAQPRQQTCNGMIDEPHAHVLRRRRGTSGVGACRAGAAQTGGAAACGFLHRRGAPATEVCDGADNNRNGAMTGLLARVLAGAPRGRRRGRVLLGTQACTMALADNTQIERSTPRLAYC